MYSRYLKKYIDFIFSFISLVVISPVLLILILFLFCANKGKVFFTQARPGINGKIFKVIKFKTMTDEKDANGNLLPDHQRLTKVGQFIRSTSLDELPQLLNILKGDMALVGPRPLLPEYLPLYSKEQQRRHNVKPGITGWAQVNGRNLCLLSKKFEYDVWYVDHISLLLDIKIVFLTFWKIIKRSDIGTGAVEMIDVDDLGFSRVLAKNTK